jgi:putative peptidoglycan lipid II flippase
MAISSSRNAFLVAAGIFFSRIIGLVRERLFAYYFGNSSAADAFKAALKIPNLLQNLFGEGALSASFIPVYARILATGDDAEARRVARVIGSILVFLMSVLVLAGVLATPILIAVIAPGFEGIKREYTIRMVRILFPGVGILVLSAWCLGILNSHRRFFLPYAAPVLWNAAMIAALAGLGKRMDPYPLAVAVAWASVGGSFLQLAVQLPAVMTLAGRFRLELETASDNVRCVFRNFLPSVGTRGVNQLSSYVDQVLASFLPTGAVAALAYAQTIYLLPVSLFGMAVSSAELPEMSSELSSGETLASALRQRLDPALRRIAFYIVPSVAAFLILGDAIAGVLFQTGKFSRNDAIYVWKVLAGAAVGLLATTLGRLYTSAFWALRDTRTPLRFAVLRVVLTTALGWFLAFPVPRWLGWPAQIGLVGLTVSAGLAGWLEFTLLRLALNRRIGRTGLPLPYLAKLWAAAGSAGAIAFAVKGWLPASHPLTAGTVTLASYGVVFFAAALLMRIPEAFRFGKSLDWRRNA